MLVCGLVDLLGSLAPSHLAMSGDNTGLLVGDGEAPVRHILVALEATEPVVREAAARGCDVILTHHPLLFAPVRSLVESRPRDRILRALVKQDINLVACHTDLDSARGGLADIAAEALGLTGLAPLKPAPAGWYKLVGFVPAEAAEKVAAAVFAAGAGEIGDYRECAFAGEGQGWFTPGPRAEPAVGTTGSAERTPEVRWETVVGRSDLGAVLRAFVEAHPYEEPAFDVYPVDDVLPRVGLGRVGSLAAPVAVATLAEQVADLYGASGVAWSGDGARTVQAVGVLPGSGRSLIDAAAGRCEVLITGDVGYHDAERAGECGVSLIAVPHGEFEWWAFRRWAGSIVSDLEKEGVGVVVSDEYVPLWSHVEKPDGPTAPAVQAEYGRRVAVGPKVVRVWIDGGSRGNPGPSAIGVAVEGPDGEVVETLAEYIGTTTNNVAEYRALLAGLELAATLGAREVHVFSDSELLVKQMSGEYKVKNEGLKPLHAEARARTQGFVRFAMSHVGRERNTVADGLVNRALDEREGAGL